MILVKFADAWKKAHTKHDWFYCKKKPVTIKAIRMDVDFEVKTLEGVHTGKAGDYLLKGIRGEIYPCRKDIFEETYEQLSTGTRKQEEIDDGGMNDEQ